jgi:hypothetical protein
MSKKKKEAIQARMQKNTAEWTRKKKLQTNNTEN